MTTLRDKVWILESEYVNMYLGQLYILNNTLGRIIDIQQLSAYDQYFPDSDDVLTLYLVEITIKVISELK